MVREVGKDGHSAHCVAGTRSGPDNDLGEHGGPEGTKSVEKVKIIIK